MNPKTGSRFGPTSQKYKDWETSHSCEVLTDSEHATICAMSRSVHDHATAASLLASGEPERVLRWSWSAFKCQCRYDWLSIARDKVIMVDVKTCQDLDLFEYDIRKYGYMTQIGFYYDGLRTCSAQTIECYFIAVEKQEPYRCGVWRIAGAAIDEARSINSRSMLEMQVCTLKGTWPTRYEGTKVYLGM